MLEFFRKTQPTKPFIKAKKTLNTWYFMGILSSDLFLNSNSIYSLQFLLQFPLPSPLLSFKVSSLLFKQLLGSLLTEQFMNSAVKVWKNSAWLSHRLYLITIWQFTGAAPAEGWMVTTGPHLIYHPRARPASQGICLFSLKTRTAP